MKVLTVGTATRDVVLGGDFFKVVRDPAHLRKAGFLTGEAQCFDLGVGGKIEIQEPVFSLGGGAANAAITFARQGFPTQALIKIGKDQNGEEILRTLKEEKISPVAVFDKKRGTAYSVILISPDGERTILNYRGASRDLFLSEIPKKDFKVDCAYVVPGAIEVLVVAGIVKKLKKNGAIIAMNPSKHYIDLGVKKLKPIFNNLDVIILNRDEAALLTGVDFKDDRGIFKKFDRLVRGLAVMTDGPKGVMVSDGKKIYRAGIYKEKKVADRTGAGDSFGSGFLAGLLYKARNMKHETWREDDIIRGIKLGSANATSNVEQVGAQTGILTKREFETQARWKNLKINVENI